MSQETKSPPSAGKTGFGQVYCGMLMGSVDAVPGVSGGTVALVMGIYDELVTAISRCDHHFLQLVRRRAWREASEHIHLGFLLRLASGIAVGLFVALSTVNYLLNDPNTRSFTLAVFFGMILASTILVARMIRWESGQQRIRCLGLAFAGAGFSFWLTTLHNANHAEPSLQYLFASGAIAICAMILPGISGAMVLWILGIYEHLSGIPRKLLSGSGDLTTLLEFGVFGIGCLLGLIFFSKLLRHLLAKHRPLTMSVLCGVMVGALNNLWPFQEGTLQGTGEHHAPHYQNVLPTSVGLNSVAVILSALVAAIVVLWIDRRFAKEATTSPVTAQHETND